MFTDESDSTSASLAVLIVAYRRPKNINRILKMCYEAGISQFYISVDAPKNHIAEMLQDHRSILEVVSNFEAETGIFVHKRIPSINQGCAVNVLAGCDWAFRDASNLIVLEDDCIPSLAFFDFCSRQIDNLSKNRDFWLICGTQFAPRELADNKVFSSSYALTWGWALTRSKWNEVREIFFRNANESLIQDLASTTPERAFWNAGARRALAGYTDVWDTILISEMRQRKKFAILPPLNLVTNLGNDLVSTHIEQDSKWTSVKAHNPTYTWENNVQPNGIVDEWLRRHFYRIRFRHLLSTKFTLLIDVLFSNRRKKFISPLRERLLDVHAS